MSVPWVDESGRHQGFPVAVLADGSEPAPLPDGRTTWWLYNGADGPRAAAVRGGCSCGWRGERVHLLDFGDDVATEAVGESTGPFADWEWHVDLAEGVVPHEVEELVAALVDRICDLMESKPYAAARAAARFERAAGSTALLAGRKARSNLMTWEYIGRAFGCGPEAALERFGETLHDVDWGDEA
ncbi:hypothetical protein [Streptomyces novaecaesareae]|uniref:hypothetical protein n=1 Tax=Streptomyces novaecaesareae TaxID=68244 RepID=UPI001FD7BA26|nr:hypothetical protein [Streptomyces novaecaesareae]